MQPHLVCYVYTVSTFHFLVNEKKNKNNAVYKDANLQGHVKVMYTQQIIQPAKFMFSEKKTTTCMWSVMSTEYLLSSLAPTLSTP